MKCHLRGVYEASDAKSDRVSFPPPKGRNRGQGRARGRLAKQAKELAFKEKPVNLATEMRGVYQTFNTLVELLAE